MPPSPSSPRPCLPPLTTTPPPKPRQTDGLEELQSTGKRVLGVMAVCYVYGDLTVRRHLEPDHRQDSWRLMWSPFPTMAASLLYVVAVTWWGPRYMSTRKPTSGFRPLMMAYNAFQVVFSAYIFWEAGMGGWFGGYSFLCQRCDYSNDPTAIRMLHAGYWFLISKFIDLMDTVFFVVNKKNEHVSLLHVCHHAIMPMCMWYGVKHHSGGHTTLMILLNAFVHMVMYLYYLLAAMGPKVRPYLWWKKYLTKLQMVQFSVIILQNVLVLFMECAVPRVLMVWVSGIAVLFFLLFADFYIKAYRRRGQHQTTTTDGGPMRVTGLKKVVEGTASHTPPCPDLRTVTLTSSSAVRVGQLVMVRGRTTF